MASFVICEYEKVRQEFPEFEAVMVKLRNDLIAKAEKDWNMPFAGRRKIAEAAARQTKLKGLWGTTLTAPGPGLDVDVDKGEFGETTILPPLFNGLMAAYQPLVTWHQWFNTTSALEVAAGRTPGITILTGAATGGRIQEDYKVGICGLLFLDKAIRVSEIKMQISDKKLVRANIEEVFGYNKPAVCFEEGYILDEEKSFDLYANVITQGPQRIKPLGLQVNKIKDKVLTNTGAPLP